MPDGMDSSAVPIDSLDRELERAVGDLVQTLSDQVNSPKLSIFERALDKEAPLLRTISDFSKTVTALRMKYSSAGKLPTLTSRQDAILMAGYEAALVHVSGKGFNRTTHRLTSLRWISNAWAYWRLERTDPIAKYAGSYIRLKLASVLIFLWWLTSDFGQSVGRWTSSVLLAIGLFALCYTTTPTWFEPVFPSWIDPLRPSMVCPDGESPDFVESLYFSATTFTTLGYGDIYPVNPIGMVLVVSEAGLGLTAFVLLAQMLSQILVYRR